MTEINTYVGLTQKPGTNETVITTITSRKTTEKVYSSTKKALEIEIIKANREAWLGFSLECVGVLSVPVFLVGATIFLVTSGGINEGLLTVPVVGAVMVKMMSGGMTLQSEGIQKMGQLQEIKGDRTASIGKKLR